MSRGFQSQALLGELTSNAITQADAIGGLSGKECLDIAGEFIRRDFEALRARPWES